MILKLSNRAEVRDVRADGENLTQLNDALRDAK